MKNNAKDLTQKIKININQFLKPKMKNFKSKQGKLLTCNSSNFI